MVTLVVNHVDHAEARVARAVFPRPLPLASDGHGCRLGRRGAPNPRTALHEPTRTDLAEGRRYDGDATAAATTIAGTDQDLHDHHFVHDHEQ